MAELTLTEHDVHFLAARLRRLFDHHGYELPEFASNDASLIGIAGSVIGSVLAGGGRWHTYEGGRCVRCGSPAPIQPAHPCGVTGMHHQSFSRESPIDSREPGSKTK